MATKIVTKNSSTASAVPTASDLVQGELAVNVADKRLFTEDNAGAIVELGTNPYNFTANHNGSAKLATTATGIDVTGTVVADGIESSGNFAFTAADGVTISAKETVGINIDSDDNDSSRAFTVTSGSSGSLETLIIASEDAGVTLYHDNAQKFATTSTGIDVTGTATMDGLTVDASSAVVQSATGTASPTPTTFNISTTSSASDWTTTSPWGRLAFYSGDTSGSGGKPHVVLDATASNAIGASSSFSISTTSESANTLSKRLNINNIGDISFYEDTGTTAKLFWDASAESLGIGTSSPATNRSLHVSSAPQNQARFERTGASTVQIEFQDSTTTNQPSLGGDGDSLTFRTSFTERMRIDSSGRVGIGMTANSGCLLNVNDHIRAENSAFLAGRETAALPAFAFHDDTDTGMFNVASNILAFSTAGTERLRIDSSGNLLVGTSSLVGLTSAGSLHIKAGGGGPYVINCQNKDTGGGASQIQFKDGSGDVCGAIISNATSNTTAYGTSSDYRLKENVSNITEAIEKLKLLQPKTYSFIADSQATLQDGFLAHELATVIPNAVCGEKDDENEDGSLKAQQVDYGLVTPLLTAALQEAITKIESLTARIAALEE